MQVIENWADIRGTIRSVNDEGDCPGFLTALIDVQTVSPVSGFANLFQGAGGQTIRVNIPKAAVQQSPLTPGQFVTCRIRKGGPHTAFAHPELVSTETT
jgi:hypothetical protein